MNICLICSSNNLKFLFKFYSIHMVKKFHPLAVCGDCGHIQINPLFQKDEYNEINNSFFSNAYSNSSNLVNNQEIHLKKYKKIESYVSPFLFNGMKVLDIGAGEGWTLNLFKNLDIEYNFIESVDLLSKELINNGGIQISKSIEDNISNYYGKYDLIIFRHVLEHLTNPREAIKKCSLLLNKTGKLYLEVPNGIPQSAVNISNLYKKGFRTSFIRPIHISYFCIENISLLTSYYGLNALILEVKNEIHGVFEKRIYKKNESANFYKRNKKIMLKYYYKFFLTDFKNIFRSIINQIKK